MSVADAITEALRERAGVWSDGKYWRTDAMLTADRFDTAAGLVGRNGAPALLFDLQVQGLVPDETLRTVLPDVWSGAEFPERLIRRETWLHWFRLADYPQPSEPLTVYRGAVPHYVRGMAWTTDPVRAGWFANRWGLDLELDPFIMAHGTAEEQAAEHERLAKAQERAKESGERRAYVYTATVEPAGVLAIMDELEPDGRGESEVIIDPAHLPRRIPRDD